MIDSDRTPVVFLKFYPHLLKRIMDKANPCIISGQQFKELCIEDKKR